MAFLPCSQSRELSLSDYPCCSKFPCKSAWQIICVRWPQSPAHTCSVSKLTWSCWPHTKVLTVEKRWRAGGRWTLQRLLGGWVPRVVLLRLPVLLWWAQSKYTPGKAMGLGLPFSHRSSQSLKQVLRILAYTSPARAPPWVDGEEWEAVKQNWVTKGKKYY